MKIKDIMKHDVISIDKTLSILDAAITMKTNDIGFLPIIDKDDVIGVITDRDIVVKALSNRARANSRASKYMSEDVYTIDEEATCEEALILMKQKKAKRLLVTNKDDLVGVISFSCVATHVLDSNIILESIKTIDKPEPKNKKDAEIDDFKL